MELLLLTEQLMLVIEELFVLLFNFSKDDYIVEKGNRIVQIIFLKCENVSFSEVECFDFVSERGTKGFGSCGLYFFLLAIKKMD